MSHKKHCLSSGTATQPNRPFQPSLNDDESARLAQEAEGASDHFKKMASSSLI
jgi:hypothetical protein